jgi:ADP-ribose pyrophosphatase
MTLALNADDTAADQPAAHPTAPEPDILFQNSFIKLVRERYHYVEFTRCSAGAVVIPVTPTGRFVMVEINRVPKAGLSIEFPRGGGEPGESPEENGLRELREETGCHALEVVHLGSIFADSATINLKMDVVLARSDSEGAGVIEDTDEVASTRIVSRAELFELIRTDKIRCGITQAALAKLLAAGF